MYRYSVCILLLIAILVGGCGKSNEPVLTKDLTRKKVDEGYFFVNSENVPVLLISGEEITPEEILDSPSLVEGKYVIPREYFGNLSQGLKLEEFKLKYGTSMLYILADTISDILLYNSAKKEIGDTLDDYLDKSIESEIKKIVLQSGDEIKADELIKEIWYDRETCKKQLKSDFLRQWYISTQENDNSFITYRQLKRKYESMKDEYYAIEPEIEFRSIDIIPSRLQITDPNIERQKYAENLANEIYNKLKSGEDFSELAKTYSQGHRKSYGGLWEPINPDSLAEPFDVIADAAFKMNPGEISEPIITDTHIFIIKLEDKISAGYIPFEQVQSKVREALIAERKAKKAMGHLDENINKQMELPETGVFVDYCLQIIYHESNKD